jgi:hypothetical protein
MAGEYSRELSTKVFQGATRMIRMGYKQGGTAVYGLRRMLVDSTGQPKAMLKTGERKSLQTDRVIYVTGPAAEIEVVCWIFKTFVEERKGPTEIARLLNRQGILAPDATLWTNTKIGLLLRNENYIGNLVYSRTSTKLRSPSVVNPSEKWVRKENALVGIVPRELFFRAREICAASYKRRHLTDAYLLDRLRALLNEQGYLSRSLIERTKQQFPSPCTFKSRFGSMASAYQMVGFTPSADQRHFEISRRLAQINRGLIDQIIREIEGLGATAVWDDRVHVLHINQELRVDVFFARHYFTDLGSSRWVLRWDARRWEAAVTPDLTMAVRMDRDNLRVHDYYLLPGRRYSRKKMRLAEDNGIYLDAYRFRTLDFLVGMAARVKFS